MNLKNVKLLRIALIMLAGSVIGFALLAAVFCLPLDNVRDPQGTAEIFRTEGNRPVSVPGYKGTMGDNYTDAVMIAEALYDNPDVSPLDQAVYVYRRVNSDSASVDIADMIEGKPMQWEMSYTRYWHGFLVVLRPLLMLLSYADIRVLMAMAQMLLFGFAIVVMTKQGKMELLVPFAAAILTLAPTGTMISMQYFASYALMMLGVLCVLCFDGWLGCGERYGYFFLLMGMLTCYFDFLTYPLVTLFIPLLLVMYQHVGQRDMMRFCVGACVLWGMGYAGFWAMKWIVGSVLVGENLVYNAYHHAKYQVSMADVMTGNRLEAIGKNLQVICKPAYALLYAGALAVCAAPLVRRRTRVSALFLDGRWMMAAVGLAPFVWWLLAASHSVVHALFTYRLLSITVLSVLLWLVSARIRPGNERA